MRSWLNLVLLFTGILAMPAVQAQPVQPATAAQPAEQWDDGHHYHLVSPVVPYQPQAGKVEVTEVFSYACPACWHFYKDADRLRASLPANAFMDYVPAAFHPEEDWPVFQRAYFAAQALNIDQRTHDQVFDAIWKTGEIGIYDMDAGRPKEQLPTIEDVAKFYQRVTGVPTAQFLQMANSFGMESRIGQAEQIMREWRVDSTPTLVIAGKYRIKPSELKSSDEVIALVKYLVAKESPHAAPAKPATKPVHAAAHG